MPNLRSPRKIVLKNVYSPSREASWIRSIERGRLGVKNLQETVNFDGFLL